MPPAWPIWPSCTLDRVNFPRMQSLSNQFSRPHLETKTTVFNGAIRASKPGSNQADMQVCQHAVVQNSANVASVSALARLID